MLYKQQVLDCVRAGLTPIQAVDLLAKITGKPTYEIFPLVVSVLYGKD